MSEQKTEQKHTPGPWTQGHSGAGIDCVWLNGLTEPEHSMGPDDTWIACNTPANARLIAAAPELLAFAQAFLADYQSEDGMQSMKHYAKQAHAAISKATGQEAA